MVKQDAPSPDSPARESLFLVRCFGAGYDRNRVCTLSTLCAIAAAGLAIAAVVMFLANYGATYGTLGAAVGLMMWMWVTAIVLLIGAELNCEIEHQTARDSTVGAAKPLGRRGAVMADTVGAAQR